MLEHQVCLTAARPLVQPRRPLQSVLKGPVSAAAAGVISGPSLSEVAVGSACHVLVRIRTKDIRKPHVAS